MKNILICLITSILSPSLSIAGCSSASEEPYAAAVANTKAKCAEQWTANILQIDNALFECYQKLQTTGTFTCNFTQGNIPFGKLKSLTNAKHSSILNLNNILNPCTYEEMKFKTNLLYANTKIRYFFVTQTIDYFIPSDSMVKFESKFCTRLKATSGKEPLIVALWLKMRDLKTGKSSAKLFIAQIGKTFFTRADISIVSDFYEGNYEESISYKFLGLFSALPKPMVLCYQVAGAAGNFSSCYLLMETHATGSPQQLASVLLVNKQLQHCDSMRSAIKFLAKNCDPNDSSQVRLLKRLQSDCESQVMAAPLQAKFDMNKIGRNEMYVLDSAIMIASAKQYLLQQFPNTFEASFKGKSLTLQLPENLQSGFCKNKVRSNLEVYQTEALAPFGAPTGFELVNGTIHIGNDIAHEKLDKILQSETATSYSAQAFKPIASSYELLSALKKGALSVGSNKVPSARIVDPALLLSAFDLWDSKDVALIIETSIKNAKATIQIQREAAAQPLFLHAMRKLSVRDRSLLLLAWYNDSALLSRCIKNISEIKPLTD